MFVVASTPPYGLTTYSILWLLIGIAIFVLILGWYALLLWMTRKKAITSIADLRPAADPLDLNALKAKYLALIDACYLQYEHHEVTKRALHRNLSITVRYFVYEANHFPAPVLTLSDLKKAPYPHLANLIDTYYVDEFAVIERGEPLLSVQAAKGVIQQWV